MQKILFNSKYGSEQAVLEGRKTMTRRSISPNVLEKYRTYERWYRDGHIFGELKDENEYLTSNLAPYKVGDVVSIAQSYKTIRDEYLENKVFAKADTLEMETKYSNGWNNKMFTRADIMPHHIKITGIKVERLQDISDEDCLREGIYPIKSEDVPQINETGVIYYTYSGIAGIWTTPRQAFASLIDKVGKKGTWASNPLCFCYSFELID